MFYLRQVQLQNHPVDLLTDGATQDPAQMYPDSAGMSVDYGLNGSMFLPLDFARCKHGLYDLLIVETPTQNNML